MRNLRYMLISDGSSDIALLPVITWLLQRYLPNTPVGGLLVDFRPFRNPPKSLEEKMKRAIELFGSDHDVLFVHRDAENQAYEVRIEEIRRASQSLNFPRISVVPIRMQEAWLLIDERAIRIAAGNPNGLMSINLPAISSLEKLPHPKNVLHGLLKTSSGLNKRRTSQFNAHRAAIDVANHIQDWKLLNNLSAFTRLDNEIREYLEQSDWLNN